MPEPHSTTVSSRPLGKPDTLVPARRLPALLARTVLLPFVLTSTALGIKLALPNLIGPDTPFLVFYSAILLGAWYGGGFAGFLSIVLSVLYAHSFFMHPATFYTIDPEHVVPILIFVAEGMLALGGVYLIRKTRKRLSEINSTLQVELDRREQVETALRESEQRYREMFEESSFVGLLIDPDREIIVEGNHAASEFYGYSRDELRNRPVTDINVHPPEEVAEALHRAKSKNRNRFIFHHRLKNGAIRPVEILSGPITIEGRRINYAVIHDISERQKAERDLVESEERSRRLFELCPIPFCVMREDGAIFELNKSYESTTGFSRDEVIGRRAVDLGLIEPEENERIKAAITSGKVFNLETHFVDKNGRFHQVLLSVDIIRFEEANYYLVVFNDITELRDAEQALRLAEQKLTHHIINSPLAVVEWDKNFRVSRWTGIAEEIYGWTEADVMGKTTFEWPFVYEEDIPAVEQVTERLLDGTESKNISRNRNYRKDGRVICSEWYNSALLDTSGHVTSILSLVQDVTERERVMNELDEARVKAEDANRLKSFFLANMSHEIRTPLTAIIGFASVLSEELTGTQHEFAERIALGGKRLSETLDSILTLARLEAGHVHLDFRTLDVNAEIKEIVSLYRTDIEEKGLKLVIRDGQPGRLLIQVDRGGFTSILQNLIGNAVKYTPSGHITIEAGVDLSRPATDMVGPEHIYVAVEDTGIGISEEFLPNLFHPFSQESMGLSREYQGSGLGLSITRQLAEKMGGSISVESQKGAGSRFTVRFPRIAELPVEPSHPVEPGLDNLSGKRILIVEDDDNSRLLLEILLKSFGEVSATSSAREALATARAFADRGTPFDVALLDIHLGGGPDGVHVLRALRGLPAYTRIPAAALTAFALPGDEERFLRDGFDRYLRKPFSREEMLETVAQLIGTVKT